jgi:hypothetical protein
LINDAPVDILRSIAGLPRTREAGTGPPPNSTECGAGALAFRGVLDSHLFHRPGKLVRPSSSSSGRGRSR